MSFIANMNNSISFGAKNLQSVTILKYDTDANKYKPFEASFVEIKPKCDSDVDAVKRLNNEWYGSTYTKNIYEDVLELSSEKTQMKSRVFALTTQKNDVNLLESKQILGIAKMSLENKKTPLLEFLEVDPDIVYSLLEPRYSRVGTGIINCLKKVYKSITLNSSVTATEFYLKNGFELINPVLLRFRWIKK